MEKVFPAAKGSQQNRKILLNGSAKKLPDLSTIYKLKVSADTDILKLVEEFKNNPNVEYAQPNYCYDYFDIIPNDPDFTFQWALTKIQATNAWETEKGDSAVIVSILDSGVDLNHPDLMGNIWRNEDEIPNNGIDDDKNGLVDDVNGWDFAYWDNEPNDDIGHGTNIAGIIGAITNNDLGIAGLTWGCKIMPVKISQCEIDGSPRLTDVWIAQGLYYSSENGAQIINMSFGFNEESSFLRDGVDYAYAKGCILIAAAGNNNSDQNIYPAAFEKVIAVAATDENDQKAYFSNYGEWVDIAAPGVNIYSTAYPNIYNYRNGTSFSAAYVSGMAALIKSRFPNFSQDDIRKNILNSADSISTTYYVGKGRINIYNSLSAYWYINPDTLNFNNVLIGNDSKMTLLINNRSDSSLIINSISTSDVHFSINSPYFPLSILPYDSIGITITFSPDTYKLYESSLQLLTNRGKRIVHAIGFGIPSTATFVLGSINGFWSREHSPYIVQGDITVSSGQSLTIEPGVEVRFDGHYKFIVNGSLNAIGTETDSVIFTRHFPTESSKWWGIRFENAQKGCELKFCRIEYGKTKEPDYHGGRDDYGGGIYCRNSNPTISFCTIQNNLAAWVGGGIAVDEESEAVIANNLIRNNVSWAGGGGIYVSYAKATISNNSIISNSTIMDGAGGIEGGRAKIIIINNTLVNNLTSTHVGWKDVNAQGGMDFDFSSATLLNNTTANNRGGLRIRSYSTIRMENCIQYGNERELVLEETCSLFANYCDFAEPIQGLGNLSDDPLFIDTSKGNYSLKPGSPCLDAGDPRSLFNDSDGSRNDMGAYGGGKLYLDSSALEFGIVTFGSSKTMNITLWNLRTEPLDIKLLDISDSSSFTISEPGPFCLSSLSRKEITVTFCPVDTGNFSAFLSIHSMDFIGSTYMEIPISGSGSSLKTVSGVVSGTWDDRHGPYYIIGDVIIPIGNTLTIGPGVSICSQGYYKIRRCCKVE
jgi:hypothetical protein